jgi:uncharacterized protein (TIGR02145 family)
MKKASLIFSILIGFGCVAYAQTVTIGTQVWMSENLSIEIFRNGDPIPEAKTSEEWIKAGENEKPAWCYYDNDPANGKKYGKLYNWYAVNDSRGLAPTGWHIPSDSEWTQLTDYLGGEVEAGSKMKNTSEWFNNGNGTNESGFSGLPSGNRSTTFAIFSRIGENCIWWSSSLFVTEEGYSPGDVWVRNLDYSQNNVIREYVYKDEGFSVRCIKD